jgi:hypothetical protein
MQKQAVSYQQQYGQHDQHPSSHNPTPLQHWLYYSIAFHKKKALFLDKLPICHYNDLNFIGQFVTILSVNKTRTLMGALRSFFDGRCASIFYLEAFYETTQQDHCI